MTYVTVAPSDGPSAMREGIRLGVLVATSIWIWIAAVDAIAGAPFHTFNVLGGIAAFTALHYLLNVAYGVMLVTGIRSATRDPGFIAAVVMGFLILEFALIMATILLSHMGLGVLAWVRVLGGSIVGAAAAFIILIQRHHLASVIRQVRAYEHDV